MVTLAALSPGSGTPSSFAATVSFHASRRSSTRVPNRAAVNALVDEPMLNTVASSTGVRDPARRTP
jgi:hypothetical protein